MVTQNQISSLDLFEPCDFSRSFILVKYNIMSAFFNDDKGSMKRYFNHKFNT
uniref:Uncharacterized protein n=1 Tax=Oryza brachyantha TaxID=4533 RepID=J3MZF5_ORYBR